MSLESPTEVINEPPTIVAEFFLHNKSSLRASLSKISFSFESTSDIQFDDTLIEIDDVLHYDGKKDVSVKFKVPGIVGVGLSVSGNVSYTIKVINISKISRHFDLTFRLQKFYHYYFYFFNRPMRKPKQITIFRSDLNYLFHYLC